MHADGGVEIGVDRGHHRGHRSPGGKPGHIDPSVVDRTAVHHLAGDPGDERRLTSITELMSRGKPVPVLARIRRGGLLRVGDEEGLTLSEVVHAGSSGERGGVLTAAVQHDDQRQGAAGAAAGHIQPVSTGTSGAGVRKDVKPACEIGVCHSARYTTRACYSLQAHSWVRRLTLTATPDLWVPEEST